VLWGVFLVVQKRERDAPLKNISEDEVKVLTYKPMAVYNVLKD